MTTSESDSVTFSLPQFKGGTTSFTFSPENMRQAIEILAELRRTFDSVPPQYGPTYQQKKVKRLSSFDDEEERLVERYWKELSTLNEAVMTRTSFFQEDEQERRLGIWENEQSTLDEAIIKRTNCFDNEEDSLIEIYENEQSTLDEAIKRTGSFEPSQLDDNEDIVMSKVASHQRNPYHSQDSRG